MVSHYDPTAESTIWRIPDQLWAECEPLLPSQKPLGTPGRPIVPFRKVLDGILYVLRTGVQWKAVPAVFGSGSTCHRRFQEWAAHGIGWDWQSADSATVPSPPRRERHRPGSNQPGQAGHQASHPQ